MSPIVELLIRLVGIISFIWFVSYWANLFSKRIEPYLRRIVSQRFGIEIERRQKGPNYHWATPDQRPKSRVLVFLWCAALFLITGGGPMLIALLVLGFALNRIFP